MGDFIDAIPAASTSPLAFAAYAIAAVLFLMAGAQLRLSKAFLQKISDVPPKERRRTLEIAADTVLPESISAEEWIRLKRLRWTFMLIGSVALIGFSVAVIALLHPSSSSSQAEDRVWQVREEIVRLRGTWETFDEENTVAIKRVFGEAPELARKMLRLDEKSINLGQRIDREEWSGYAYFMAADAAHRLGNKELAGEWIDAAVYHLKTAQTHIAEADRRFQDNSADSYYSKLQGQIYRSYDRERIAYLLAMTFALDRFARGQRTDEEVVELVRSVNPQRLAELEVDPKYTPYVGAVLTRNNWRF